MHVTIMADSGHRRILLARASPGSGWRTGEQIETTRTPGMAPIELADLRRLTGGRRRA
jgi:hypothetical protein